MKKKNYLLGLLALFLLQSLSADAGMFSSLFNKEKESKKELVKIDASKPGYLQDRSEITFDWYINYSWFSAKWGEDYVTKDITEKTGVNINYIVPSGDRMEKLNTMIASNTLPDFITVDSRNTISDIMIKGNHLFSIDELAKNYDPFFFKVASKDKLNWFKKEDGHTYGYPNASYTLEDYKNAKNISSIQSFLVRKDMYEAIGRPDMSTPKGFLDALRAVKKKFSSVDGEHIVPIGLQEGLKNSLVNYLQNFLAIPLEKDGEIYDRFGDEEYITWLKVFRQAYEEELLLPEVFVDKRSQIEEKIAKGRYFSMLYPHTDALWPLAARYNEDPDSAYIAIDGPKNSKGDEHQLSGPVISGWTVTFISKNCKEPERAIRFMTYMLSEEGQKTIYLGKKGITWDVIDGKEQLFPEVEKLREENRKRFDQIHGAENKHWMLMDNAMQQRKWGLDPSKPSKQMVEWTYEKIFPRFQFEMIEPNKNTREGIISDKIRYARNVVLSKLITTESEQEFDKILNDFFEEREKFGFKELQDYKTAKVQENKIKLGLE